MSEQDDEFFAKLQEIHQQLSEINNFLNKEETKFDEQMTNNYEYLQRIARSNYVKIFSFDKYLPLPVSEEQLIESFIRNDVKMTSFANLNSAAFQTTGNCIRDIYQKKLSQPFAEATYRYFTEYPEELPIFAYITFPALYGFFLSLDHLAYAFDYLTNLMSLEINFSLPFFVAFLTSAHVFVDIFWEKFFTLVNEDNRLKPSIAQLFEYIIKSLQYSANYLTPQHFSICIQCLYSDPKIFYDCFFKRFLLSTFNAWTSYNPSISSSKVTEEDLDKLFTYFIENPEGRVAKRLEEVLTGNFFSFNELYSFVENSSSIKYAYLLSPRELKLISHFFRKSEIPELKKIFDYESSIFKGTDFTSFVAGSFYVYFNAKGSQTEEERLIFKEASESEKQMIKESSELRKKLIKEGHKELERAIITIQLICENYKLDRHLMLMTCNNSNENDTIYEKIVKKKIKKLLSPELKKYILGFYQETLVNKQNEFENYLSNKTFTITVNNMKLKLIRYGEIMEHLFLPKLKNKDLLLNKKMFTKNLIIFEMFETVDCSKPSFIECQKNFFECLKHYKNPRLLNFLSSKDSLFLPLVLALAKADELSLGERFFLLHNVYSQIAVVTEPIGREKIFDDPSGSLNTLFAYLLVKADFRSFINTYINVCSFKNKFKEKFEMFPPEMIEKWNAIQSFVMSVIQDEHFDIQSRLTIQTFSQ